MSNSEQNKKDVPGQTKEQSIIVNGRPRTFEGKEIIYSQIVALAFDSISTNPNIVYSVTYKRGEGNKPEGTMDTDDVVKVKDGMIFNVTATDKS
ncbi:multiubiquitin domain-containing protein (plasmid) [Adhaeribacter swui]|uniref:Multiubiquitin domain-containing protein n=1 Tax=Adhaeribacter swui TaxID=2086471 RepID=A0A7G7G262_9BACT|nr:multiubiquitin domain-containing protein [Adhaeribacter swui]QNF31246.1 multiubiquitin domain-containing protein [Adhaeribacter swui]